MGFVKTDAVILRRINYSNTSQILYLYTADGGQVHVLAQGARRVKNRYHATVDKFFLVEAVYRDNGRSDLHFLSELAVLEHYPGLRTSLEKIWMASYTAELALRMTRIGDPVAGVFDALVRCFSRMSDLPANGFEGLMRNCMLEYEVALLRQLGFLPQMEFCVACHNNLSSEERLHISTMEGGLICRSCFDAGRLAYGAAPELSQGSRAIMQRIAEDRGVARLRISAQNWSEIRRYLSLVIRGICGVFPVMEKYMS